MTDVRLTALNPVDSQVYPVACNTSGELLVAGDGVDYLPLTGGDLTGDLTLGTDKIALDASDGSITAAGSASFAGEIRSPITYAGGGSSYGCKLLPEGVIQACASGDVWQGYDQGNAAKTSSITAAGSVSLAGALTSNGITQYMLPTMGNGGQLGWDDGSKSLRLYANSSTNTNAKIQFHFNQSNTAGITFNQGGSATFLGTVTATVVPPSDKRFKENITPAKPQLPDVVALGGILKNYNWNTEAPVNDEIRAQRQLGLIAQEAAEICPNLVKELGSEENRYKGIPMEALIMKLIGAVSELKAELNQMKIT